VRVLSVVGARPQFVKSAVVERALTARGIEVLGVHTGQHYDERMSELFFRQLGIAEPYVNLGIGSGSHGVQTGRMLAAIEAVIAETQPAAVVVYGDTNSTLAATLAASKLLVPVAHVEAGLRSYNRRMPEEQNRIVADHLCTVALVPSQTAMDNLAREGLAQRAVLVGDVMRDAQALVAATVDPAAVCSAYGVTPGGFVLSTLHRAENTDDPDRLQRILHGLASAPLPVLLPLHPRTRSRLGEGDVPAGVRVVQPVGYIEMIALETACERIATDSGGVQKEALWAGVPCVTLRDETEWVETVEAGWNTLVGADTALIEAALKAPPPDGTPAQLYGDGAAGARIAEIIEKVAVVKGNS
jgi:UDP-GlcNAc3NAcA epimerase